MKITVKELAAMVGGRLEGNGEVAISAARALNEAGPGAITFLDNPKHLDQLRQSKASAAVVAEAVADADFPLIRIADPLMAFVTIFRHFHAQPELPPHGIDARASVHSSAKIGEDASVMPFAVIGAQTVIGARCRVESGAVIGRGCILADDVTIHANSVLYDGTRVGNRVTTPRSHASAQR